MNPPIRGHCVCGDVRYEASAAPIVSAICHCRDCRRATGGTSYPALAVPSDTFRLTGKVGAFETIAESGNRVTRSFCVRCGSTLFARSTGMTGITQIAAATLEEPAAFAPQIHVFARSAPAWDPIPATGPVFDGMPPLPSA